MSTATRPAPARNGRTLKTYKAQVRSVGDDEEPTFEALVSVFGNVDSYGDRMMPGAFKNTLEEWQTSGDPIPVIWSHDWGNPMAHIGEVTSATETDQGLRVRGTLDADTDFSRQAYRLLKARRVKEFSFAFDYVDSAPAEDADGKPEFDDWGWPVFNVNEVKLYEVGPCLVGANPATELYQVKRGGQLRQAIASHSTATSDAAWDGPGNVANLSNDDGADVYHAVFAWQDPDGDPDTKSAYKFPHHFVSADGKPGAASTVACSAGIGVLNGGRGGSSIPDADRQGVYNHLARHMKDADMTPPELKSRGDAMESKLKRAGRLLATQLRAGRVFSKQNADAIQEAVDKLDTIIDAINDAVDDLGDTMGDLAGLLDVTLTDDDDGDGDEGQSAQPDATETDGKAAPRATRDPASWEAAFEEA